MSSNTDHIDASARPQGDLVLLGTDIAIRLLSSRVPAPAAARRYMGDTAVAEYLTKVDQPGTVMARISVRPQWVATVDFRTCLPGGLTP